MNKKTKARLSDEKNKNAKKILKSDESNRVDGDTSIKPEYLYKAGTPPLAPSAFLTNVR